MSSRKTHHPRFRGQPVSWSVFGAGGVMKDFRQLQVWQKAHQLTLTLYRLTASFPHDEIYGLTSQIRRAAVSISANLAEGCGRSGDAELASFCSIACGSASELEYLVLLVRDLKLVSSDNYPLFAVQIT